MIMIYHMMCIMCLSAVLGDEFRDVDADMYSDTSSMTGVSAISSSHSRSTGSVFKTNFKIKVKGI